MQRRAGRTAVSRSPGLGVIVSEGRHAQLHAALSLACSAAALGRPVRLFFSGAAVSALATGHLFDEDGACAAAGVPTVGELLLSAAELEVGLTACQSGLALTGLTAPELRPGVDTGGMIAFLAADPLAHLVAF
jgi:peroxiredoxin family protein